MSQTCQRRTFARDARHRRPDRPLALMLINKVVIGLCELFHARAARLGLRRGNSKSGGSNGNRRSYVATKLAGNFSYLFGLCSDPDPARPCGLISRRSRGARRKPSKGSSECAISSVRRRATRGSRREGQIGAFVAGALFDQGAWLERNGYEGSQRLQR
ncbi:MAG: hypothetical protein QOI93_5897 [Rhodospirillaceae bacterium]|nr:hypothetical protein [Rhodospirillaceae bacterium]